MIYSREQARLNLITAIKLIDKAINLHNSSLKYLRRDGYERKFRRLLETLYADQRKKILKALGDPPRYENIPEELWLEITKTEINTIMPFLAGVAVDYGEELIKGLPIGIDWALFNKQAIDWASSYVYDLVTKTGQTTRDAIRSNIQAFFREGMDKGDLRLAISQLEDSMGNLLGPIRAQMIATTEITRASVEGQRFVVDDLKNEGIEMVEVWRTDRDEVVCEICAPRDGRALGDGWEREDGPPAHPNCRCETDFFLPGYDWKQ